MNNRSLKELSDQLEQNNNIELNLLKEMNSQKEVFEKLSQKVEITIFICRTNLRCNKRWVATNNRGNDR